MTMIECTWPSEAIAHSGPAIAGLRFGWPKCGHADVDLTPTCPRHLMAVVETASRPRLATPCPGCGKHSVRAVVGMAGIVVVGEEAEAAMLAQGWCSPGTLTAIVAAAGGSVTVSLELQARPPEQGCVVEQGPEGAMVVRLADVEPVEAGQVRGG